MEVDSGAGEGILHPGAGAGDCVDRRVHVARPLPVLFLLGIHADPDGAVDRNLRPRTQGVRGGQVLPLHDGRLGFHASGHVVAIRKSRQLRFGHHRECHSLRTGGRVCDRGPVALPRILCRFCRQSASVPFPHLAAGCSRGSSHRRIGIAGRRSAQDGDVWPAALQPRTVSRTIAAECTVDLVRWR